MFVTPNTVGLHLNSNTDPASLFVLSKLGAWYDPSDFSTMFQDYQGRTPVTAVGQPVSLILDKSANVTGPELAPTMGASADWINVSGATNITVTSNVLSWEVSLTGGTRQVRSASNTNVNNIGASGLFKWYKVSAEVRQTTGTTGKILYLNIYSAAVNFLGASNQVSSTTDWQEVSCYVNTNNANFLLVYYAASNPTINDTFEMRSLSVKEISGNHCQQFTITKAPLLQQDANNNYYLDFDGSDDFLQCRYSLINSSDTAGAYVCAGVTKDSDAARGMIFGYNTTDDTTNNSLSLYGPSADANTDYGFQAKGDSGPVALTSSATAPNTSVLTGLMSQVGPYTKLRVNGVEQATSSTTLGTVLLATYRNFFIGGRQGTSLFFDGRLYGLIFVPSQPNFEKVTTAERYINGKTAAY